MTTPQDKEFANLAHQLHRDLPLEPLTRVVNLAAVALGILRSKSLQGGQTVTASPLEGSRGSLKKRVQRFLKNASVSVEEYYQPLATRLLRRLVAGGARVHLTLDRTEWGDFNISYVCVGWRGRALPLLWRVPGPGASSFAEQKEILEVVARWLPRGARVLLLGDREFGTGVLAQWAVQQGWGVCLRLRAHEYVRRAGTLDFEMLPLVLPGERRFWSQVAFPQTHAVTGLNLAMYWAPRPPSLGLSLPLNRPVNSRAPATPSASGLRKCLKILKTLAGASAWNSLACAMLAAWRACCWPWRWSIPGYCCGGRMSLPAASKGSSTTCVDRP